MDFGRAFGAGGAGTPFDPLTFIKKPQVILRLVSLLFSIIVFGCISSGGYIYQYCIMNQQANACNYGTGIGVIAFIAAIGFLLVDALYEQISSVQNRKYLTMADLAFSGIWSFLWFVGFCYLTNEWRVTSATWLHQESVEPWMKNNVRASIAFCFFSIFVWAGLTYLALQRYREGAAGAFQSTDEIEDQLGAGPGGYQQPPMGEPIMPSDSSPTGGNYQTGPSGY